MVDIRPPLIPHLLIRTGGEHSQPHHSVWQVRFELRQSFSLFLSFRSMSNLFNHLLSCLCIADIISLISNLLVLPLYFGFNNSFMNFVFPFLESSCHVALSVSIFLIITITIERWQAVCYPYLYQVKLVTKQTCFLTNRFIRREWLLAATI